MRNAVLAMQGKCSVQQSQQSAGSADSHPLSVFTVACNSLVIAASEL